MARAMGTQELQRRAIQKALIRRDGACFRRVCLGTYKVGSDSRPGAWHTVRVAPDGQYSCSCEAGLAGRPCWHAALTYIVRLEKNSGVTVAGPATADVTPLRRAA